MSPAEFTLVLELLKAASPHLQKMAQDTDNPFDNMIINIEWSESAVNIDISKTKKGDH